MLPLKHTLALAFLLPTFNLAAADIGAVWESTMAGTLNGTNFTVVSAGNLAIYPRDLSGPDFSYAPLSTSENVFGYPQQSHLTFQFASPVKELRLHLSNWRPGTYTLNRAFEIRSGTDFTKSGNEITVNSRANGIIEFTEDVSVLTIEVFEHNGSQSLQFSVAKDDAPSLSPAPPTLSIQGGDTLRTRKRTLTLRGTASGVNEIRRVEYRVPGKGYKTARGTRNWMFQFRPDRRRSRLPVRAVDVTALSSKPDSVTVVRLEKKPENGMGPGPDLLRPNVSASALRRLEIREQDRTRE